MAISEIVNLVYLDFSKTFTVDTDTNEFAIKEVFTQENEQTRKQPVAFFSRILLKCERRYAVTRTKMLAVVSS